MSPRRELPESHLPEGTAACLATVGDDNPRPALVVFEQQVLTIRRDDRPEWSAPASSLDVKLKRYGLAIQTIQGEHVELDFSRLWRTRSERLTGPIGQQAADAAYDIENRFGGSGRAGPSLVTLRALRFHELVRFLDRRARSVERAKRYTAGHSLSSSVAIPFMAVLILLASAGLLVVWFLAAVFLPALVGVQFWDRGFEPIAPLAALFMAAASLGGSNLLASSIPGFALSGWREMLNSRTETAGQVEDLAYVFGPFYRHQRFRPLLLHVVAQLAVPAYAAVSGSELEWPSIPYVVLIGVVALPAVAGFGLVVDALRRSGFRRAATDPWLETFGTAENVLWARANWAVAATIVLGGTILHILALVLFGP